METVNNDTIPLTENLEKFIKATGDAALGATDQEEQKKILQKASVVVDKSLDLLMGAHETVTKEDKSTGIKSMTESSKSLTESMNSVILALPGNNIETSIDLMKTLGDELFNFNASIEAFDINALKTGQKRMDVFNNL